MHFKHRFVSPHFIFFADFFPIYVQTALSVSHAYAILLNEFRHFGNSRGFKSNTSTERYSRQMEQGDEEQEGRIGKIGDRNQANNHPSQFMDTSTELLFKSCPSAFHVIVNIFGCAATSSPAHYSANFAFIMCVAPFAQHNRIHTTHTLTAFCCFVKQYENELKISPKASRVSSLHFLSSHIKFF